MSALKQALHKPVQEAIDLWNGWKKFWFEPQDVATVALLRILAGGMILYTHLIWSLRLEEFFGPNGWQPAEVVNILRSDGSFWSFWWYVPESMMWPVHWACIAILTFFFIGLWTPVTSKLAFLIVVSYTHRAPLATYGLDQINGFLALYLALAPCGQVGSVDWILRRRRQAKAAIKRGQVPQFPKSSPSPWARLATRLIQIQLCVLYTYAGLAKLKGEAWWDGSAMWMAAANLEYQSNSMLWLAWLRPVSEFLTHATIIWEVTFWATVWNKRTRPYALLAGAMMHLGIGGFMGMWTFGLVMTFAYHSFTPPQEVRRWAHWLWSFFSLPRLVEYAPGNASSLSWRAALDFNDDLSYRSGARNEGTGEYTSKPRQIPATWSEAVSCCETVEDGSKRVFYVDNSPSSRSCALSYFAKHGYETTVAPDWSTARLLRVNNGCDYIVLNAHAHDEQSLSEIEAELADDDHVSVVVLTSDREEKWWVRSGDIVLNGESRLRDVRHSLEAMDQSRVAGNGECPDSEIGSGFEIPIHQGPSHSDDGGQLAANAVETRTNGEAADRTFHQPSVDAAADTGPNPEPST